MTILWVSRHLPLPRQRDELRRLFGDHDLKTDPIAFADAADIANRFRQAGASEIVCVAPLSVLKKLLEYGIRPLCADMKVCAPPGEVTVRSHRGERHYKFVKFQRLTGIEMNYRELEPYRSGQLK